jgi:hypothetical protein
MTDEPKRRSYAIDDVETIARRMKEIAAERSAAIAETELPCDVEPSAFAGATLVKQANGDWLWMACEAGPPSIYADEYWQPLIDAGILTVGDA